MFLVGNLNIQTGSGSVFTLDYDQLVSIAGSKDSYFSEKAVIKEVLISFKESSTVLTRGQMKSLCYKDGLTTDQINFSLKANPGTWDLFYVFIKDFDGGYLILDSSDIPNYSSYAINLTEAI